MTWPPPTAERILSFVGLVDSTFDPAVTKNGANSADMHESSPLLHFHFMLKAHILILPLTKPLDCPS